MLRSRLIRLSLLIICLAPLTLPAQEVPVPAGETVAAGGSSSSDSPQPTYQVGPGDVLKVETFQHQEISGEFPVEDGGAISFPLLGHVTVADMAPSEISRLLEQLLERDYYVDVQLQVEVKEYRSRPVTVLGEVQRPGTYYLKGKTSLTGVLAEAGGVRQNAGPDVELHRVLVNEAGEEQHQVLSFATSELLSGKQGTEIELRAGDVISVPAKQLFFISGEVVRPGQYEIASGLTLMQAISQAGGVSKFASQGVELHRDAGDGQEKQILSFDLSRIRKGKSPDEEIQAGDVIIVKRRFF